MATSSRRKSGRRIIEEIVTFALVAWYCVFHPVLPMMIAGGAREPSQKTAALFLQKRTANVAGGKSTGQSARHRPGQVGGSVQTCDANGNLTGGSGRSYQWTSYNLPREITRGTTQTRFIYDAARGRSVQDQWQNTGGTWARVKRTVVAGNYERIEEGATTKHRVYVGGVAVVTLVQQLGQSDAEYTRWLHSDHLGSVSVVTNECGAVLERCSYDAWGARRNLNGTNVPLGGSWTGLSSAWSQRGFTGHEMLEELGLIHMKGRVYNPEQGQFTSADSYVQDATLPGMFNSYSYLQVHRSIR